VTLSQLSGLSPILDAAHAAGLHEGCTAAMTARHAARRQRPEQRVRLSWRPDSNRDRLFTRCVPVVWRGLTSVVLAGQVGCRFRPVRNRSVWSRPVE
jgi:hypothetical protein